MPRAPGLAALLLLAACWQLAAAAREDPFAAAAAKEAEAVAGAALGGDRVVLTTIFGQMPIKLYRHAAPETTKLVMEMAKAGCAGCKFYRNEGKPWVSAVSKRAGCKCLLGADGLRCVLGMAS